VVEGYGFDPSWSDERRRLALLERCYDPVTTSRLARLGAGIDSGIELLRDPTAFEPGAVWYTAWGRREQA
jgi:hypothetical protein